MNQEIRQCQNCKTKFTIEPDDFAFYQKIQVPPPTWCPECRFQRRLIFRNERSLYKRKCDLCDKDIVTVHSPDKKRVVYCNPCWWSDKWDGLEFGRGYDPKRSFFDQFRELQQKVPFMALVVDYPTLVSSEYVNHAGHLKNCYLIFDADYCDNVLYSEILVNDKDSMDCTMLNSSELCYENVDCARSSRTFFSEDCADCNEVYFSKRCRGCNNCFGCINLRGKGYYIFNKPYSKEDYHKKISELDLGSYGKLEALKKEVAAFWNTQPRIFMEHGTRSVNVSGQYVFGSKNVKNSYIVVGAEDARYIQRISMGPAKDLYDYTEFGNNAQRIYECITVGEYVDNIKFSHAVWRANCMNIEYSMYVLSSSNIFGCVGMKNKQYCILNKQYTKGGYEKLVKSIVEDMNSRPHIDTQGRTWKYGEFFPYELSLYDYNETTAVDYFPLTKERVLDQGLRWHDQPLSEHKTTLKSGELPDDIKAVSDAILSEVLECGDCKKAFRIIRAELDLLRRFGFPLPRKCSNCRHGERVARMNPPRLWSRTCAKCGKKIETSYPPESPAIVYCEQCYQSEVA